MNYYSNLRLKFEAVTEWNTEGRLDEAQQPPKGQAPERVGRRNEGLHLSPPRPSQLSHPESLERPDSAGGTMGTASSQSRPPGALTVDEA